MREPSTEPSTKRSTEPSTKRSTEPSRQPSTGRGTQPASGASQEVHENHGHSTAAWTAVTVILVAALVMSLAVVFASPFWFVVGAVLAVLGMVTGKVMAMAGFGQKAGTHRAARGEGREQAEMPGRSQHDSGTR